MYSYHSWNTAAPIIMSQVLFQRPLSADGLRLVMRREEKSTSSGWFSWGRSTTLKKQQTVSQQQTGLRYKASEPIMNGASASPTRSSRLAAASVAETESLRSSSPPPSTDHRPRYNYAKSLRLSSDQLKSLDLQDGINTVQFSVYSSFQGKAVCSAKIFLWNHDAKIVISDVDGTITKSDVLGHVFTMGKFICFFTLYLTWLHMCSWERLDARRSSQPLHQHFQERIPIPVPYIASYRSSRIYARVLGECRARPVEVTRRTSLVVA